MRLRPARLAVATAFALLVPVAAPAGAAAPNPVLLRDVMTGTDSLGSLTIPPDPIQDYVQPDTQLERASDAVVAFGPDNVVYANSLIFDLNVNNGLRSAMAVNVSKDGGKTWSDPVIFQDDNLGGLNDKNWIVVDNSDAPGHHKGRVYVVWDRIAPILYDYCDNDCDKLSNWLPDFQSIPGLIFAGQGVGAYPIVMKNGGLGIVMNTE